jgi:hypothetical protein
MLEEDLKVTETVGQISTGSGEEILCTTSDTEETNELNQLTNAFVEADTLAASLKLGNVQQVINCTKDKSYTVQSKVEDSQDKNNALVTTAMGKNLDNTLVGDGILKQTAQNIL